MKIEINYQPSSDTYDWKMYTGPDGIDEHEGNELDLGQCFEQIITSTTLFTFAPNQRSSSSGGTD